MWRKARASVAARWLQTGISSDPGGVTRRTACAREAPSEPVGGGNRACPVGGGSASPKSAVPGPFRPLFQSAWGFCFVPARFDLASRRFLTVAGMTNTSADYLSNRTCTAVRTKARGKTEHVRRRADEREGEKIKKEEGGGGEKRGATRGLPRGSPILILLTPKHASLRSSDGIRCISAGMIAPERQSALYSFVARGKGVGCGAMTSNEHIF